ncbi:MAG: class I SAM-dependent methyltransferase [Chloroflexota bacterium]
MFNLAQINTLLPNGQVSIPPRLEKAIQDSIGTDYETVLKAGEELRLAFDPVGQRITVDYTRPEIVDAYTLFYTRRNTLIPLVAMRDLLLNRTFLSLGPRIRMLDLGAGTGAVTIGMLDLFTQPFCRGLTLTVDALDSSQPCLERLKLLQRLAGLHSSAVNTSLVDFNRPTVLEKTLGQSSYDLIFAANVFNELDHEKSLDVLRCLPNHLAKLGAIVVVNAQKDYVKELMPKMAALAQSEGLHVYYPCPPGITPSEFKCWFWREHQYQCKQLRVSGRLVVSRHREQLVANWLVLVKQPCSIYDSFMERFQNLDWGVLSVYGDDSRTCDCPVCTSSGIKNIGKQDRLYKRGSIVGGLGEPFRVVEYVEL